MEMGLGLPVTIVKTPVIPPKRTPMVMALGTLVITARSYPTRTRPMRTWMGRGMHATPYPAPMCAYWAARQRAPWILQRARDLPWTDVPRVGRPYLGTLGASLLKVLE